MDIRERNSIIGVISIIVGVILIISLLLMIMTSFTYSPLLIFLTSTGYLYLGLFVLATAIFLFGFFLIKPTQTARGISHLAIGALVFGGLLVILPVIGIVVVMIYSSVYFGSSSYFSFLLSRMIQLLVLLIPGAALTFRGFFLRKKSRTEDTIKNKLKKMDIRERNSIIGVISIIVGVILIFSLLLMMTSLFYSPSSMLDIFVSSVGYFSLDLFVLATAIFLFGFFLIKPAQTARGRSHLATGAFVFGGILAILPVIVIGFVMFSIAALGFSFYFDILYIIIPLLGLFIPGAALTVHGFFLRKKSRTEDMKAF